MKNNHTPTVLTIAGSDTYAGAGIQIDMKTIHKLGAYAFTVPTALTSQNSTGVKDVFATPIDVFEKQLEAVLEDVQIDAVKIGMLANKGIIVALAKVIDKYQLKNIVLDTVMVSSSGKNLLESSEIEIMVKELFPRVDLITPNIPEVNALLGSSYMGKPEEVKPTVERLFALGINAVLLKGGHGLERNRVTDYLIEKSHTITEHTSQRVNTTHTHGTGCILSSSIATHLALGHNLTKSVSLSKQFMYEHLVASSNLKFNYLKEELGRKEPIF